jgi:hypothetical protein
MLRILAGVASVLLLTAAGFFLWRSQAREEALIPPAPASTPYVSPLRQPPSATPGTTGDKRFARADKDRDGRITRAEMLQPRQKAFAKLDADGDGRLSFDEWAVKTSDKFAGADADGSGWLSPGEYQTTKPKPAARKKCAC